MLVQERHVWTFNVNTILDNSLLHIIIGLGAQGHKEAQLSFITHVNIRRQLLNIRLQEMANLVMGESVPQ